MKKEAIRYYALSIIFLAVAIIFYDKSSISIGKFLLFFACGAVFGVNIILGLKATKKKQKD
jgi:uncharacterized membrane protein